MSLTELFEALIMPRSEASVRHQVRIKVKKKMSLKRAGGTMPSADTQWESC